MKSLTEGMSEYKRQPCAVFSYLDTAGRPRVLLIVLVFHDFRDDILYKIMESKRLADVTEQCDVIV